MFQYVALTDGVSLCELTDGVSYALISYAPSVAPLRDSKLGGDGQYSDVTESITVHALGCTAAEAYANAAALNSLLDGARRFWLGQAVSPVLLKVQAQNSALAPLAALVKGRAPSTPPALALPAVYHEYYGKYVIESISLQFVRRGLWLGASESASASAANNPSVRSVTMPTSPTVPGPLEIDFTGFTTSAGTGNIDIPSGFVFVGPNNAFNLQEGEAANTAGLAAGATFVSTADAAARASAGNVGHLNHSLAAVGAESTLSWTLPAAFLNATRVGIFCTYRNNGAASWTIRASALLATSSLGARVFTPLTTIAAAASNPQAIYVGSISGKNGFDTVELRVALTGGAGVGTIDVDTILIVDLSSDAAFALALGANQFALGASFASKNAQVTIDYTPNTRRDADVKTTVLTTAAILATGYSGDAAIVGAGGTLQAVWYATHLYNGATPYWTTQNNAGAAILQIGATITRRLAYLVPQ
jgi:hypothetical protein